MKKMNFLPLVALTLLLFGAQAASAKVITVDDNGADCRKPDFNSIQAAVSAAAPGDTIKVCAGNYPEQVTIPAGKNDLTLRSHTPLAAVIKAPPVMVGDKAIVLVRGAQNVTIYGFTIAGPGGGPCDSIRYGVRVDGGGSATISHNHIVDIRDNAISGCQNGNAIQVGRQFEGQTGRATIIKNTIERYQKTGVIIDNAGSSAEIRDNKIVGLGASPIIAQNGVQVSRGATADVQHNEISGNVFTPGFATSTGVLLFQSGNVTVAHNEISTNDSGIYSFDSSGPVIQHNKVSVSTYDGIDLIETTGANVSYNFSEGAIGFDGIYVDSGSSGNTITGNQMENNTEHDAHDDSAGPGTGGTANIWEKNHCGSPNPENRPGLCEHNN